MFCLHVYLYEDVKELRDSCELLWGMLGIEAKSSGRAASAFNLQLPFVVLSQGLTMYP